MNVIQKICLLSVFITASSFSDVLIIENQGNTIIPKNETEICMEEETVRILPDGNFNYMVYCEFILTNHSDKPLTKKVAFPISDINNAWRMSKSFKVTSVKNGATNTLATSLQIMNDIENPSELAVFYRQACQANEDIGFKKGLSKDLSYPGYIVWQQKFNAGETQIVRCEYPMGEPARVSYGRPFEGIEFEYIVRTGALWKGNIKQAKIILCLREQSTDYRTVNYDKERISYPDNAKWESPSKDKLVWSFTDWEPSEDIILALTKWNGYSTNDICSNGYALPEPYLGSQKSYAEGYMDQLIDAEVQRVSKYYPERKLDHNFLHSMIAEHLFYELFARHGDHLEGPWFRYFRIHYALHGGWYQPNDPKRTKPSVLFIDLTPMEQRNALFLKDFINSDLIRAVPE